MTEVLNDPSFKNSLYANLALPLLILVNSQHISCNFIWENNVQF